MKKAIAFILVAVMASQLLAGCANQETSSSDQLSEYTETIIEEEFYSPTTISEENISEKLIEENLIFEDSCYELRTDEQTICEAYTFETIVGDNTEEYVRSQLPDSIDNYDIDWPSVIGKFAAGSAIIIVVGVICHYTKGATYYIFASPVEVATEAAVGGAMFAALNVVNNTKDGKLPKEALKKYAVEGFANGYMWGAITSVGNTFLKSLKLPKKLKFDNGTTAKIKLDGSAVDDAGNVLGKAYAGKNGVYLKDEAGNIINNVFSLKGKEIVGEELSEIGKILGGKLPKNTLLKCGTGDAAKTYMTDAAGNVFKVEGKLLPNNKYTLNGILYETDDLGRIIKATFSQLEKKQSGRLLIENSLEEIGRGFQKAGDDRGHIIGDQFGGDNTLANIVAMNYKLNRGEYKAMETTWAEAIADGKDVSGTIDIIYDAASFRPSTFEVTYSIGSELFYRIFKNF